MRYIGFQIIILLVSFLLAINFVYAGNNQWTPCTTGIPYGLFGAYAIAVSPSNPQVIYFSGGYGNGDYTNLFRSNDAGNTWSLVTSLGVFIRSIVIDPYSSNTVYLGTQGLSLQRSIDGGSTFNSSSTGLQTSAYPIVIDPLDSNILYTGGLLSKSTDWGQTWSLKTMGINMGVEVLAIDPMTPENIYCSDYYWVYKSTNGGNSWSVVTTGITNLSGDYALAVDYINPQIVYLGKHTGALMEV